MPEDTQGQAGRGSEHLVELWVLLFIAGEWDQMAFKGPFQLKQFYDSDSSGLVLMLHDSQVTKNVANRQSNTLQPCVQ